MEITDERLETMQQGARILVDWLEDLLRIGLANIPAQGTDTLEQFAASMVDWKLPGIARQIRAWGPRLNQDAWEEDLLLDIGRFQLMCAALTQFNTLNAGMQADALQYAGVNVRKEALSDAPEVQGHWKVMGLEQGITQGLQWRRTWLYGELHRTGYLDDYVWGESAYFEHNWKLNDTFTGSLSYYPGAVPQRLWVREFQLADWPDPELLSYADFETMGRDFATALARNPWMDAFPALLQQLRLRYDRQLQQWMLWDKNGRLMRCDLRDDEAEKMEHILELQVFGAWNGRSLKVHNWF